MNDWSPAANAIFLQVVEIDAPEEQRAWLDRACGNDTVLRAQVESLLTASERVGSFLESPAPGLNPATGLTPVTEGPGTSIGRYKLLQQIGEGGFGVVFLAEQQEPVQRHVALKIIKPGMDSKQVIARFEAEEQALALMDHPNIARVLDAGLTESGRPYFVMELVKGIPITDYCAKGPVALRDRLQLFISVCEAVQHAHQKGVIHRDLKPSNVLITLRDGVAVVKIIDFGVAKALNRRLTDKTLFTHFAQMVGTPLYMSPEQAEMSGLDVDTRTDIYSLGVLLYELLTGTTPFDRDRLCDAAYDEVRRIIRDEEPPKPSTRIGARESGSTKSSADGAQDTRNLVALVRGELDWIVMKALEKERGRRYATAKDLAADIQRHLNNEPVQAGPPSAAYRFRKYVRRHQGLFAAVVVVLTTLLAGTGVSVWQAIRATRAERLANHRLLEANSARRQAEDALDRLRRTRSHAYASVATTLSLMKEFEMARLKYAQALEFDPENALANNNFAWFLVTCPDPKYRDVEQARALAAKAIATVPDAGLFWNTVGVAEYRAGNWDAAIQAIERSRQLLRDEHASHNLFFLAMSYWQLGRKDEAREAYDQSVSWMQKTRPTDEELLRFCAEAASLLGNEGTTDEPGESIRQEPTKEE